MNGFGGVPLKPYLQKQGIVWFGPAGHSLLTSDLKHGWKTLKAGNWLIVEFVKWISK